MVAGECEGMQVGQSNLQGSFVVRLGDRYGVSVGHGQAKLDTYPISKPLVRTSSALILPQICTFDSVENGTGFSSLTKLLRARRVSKMG